MKHWFHKLPESGQATVGVEEWERKASEMDELEKRRKEISKELKELDELICKDLRKDWTLEEICEAKKGEYKHEKNTKNRD